MEKVTHFLGQTEQGIFAQALFGSAGAFEKVAGAEPFADWETGEQIRRYIAGVTREERKRYCYVLVNALGAGEFFGSNINADYFPWESLKHEGQDYGYQTFLRAHAFQHHKNKDPERAFGVPVLSALNRRMKRVELITRLDREKAKFEGAGDVVDRIDRGEFPDVSMGCKVPYDVCSICGNKAKGMDDYCVHIKPTPEFYGIYGKNKILDDGRRIFMINLWPRFFDISFVFIGADKTAKVMTKLAAKGNQVCMGPVCAIPLEKTAAAELVDTMGRPLRSEREKTAAACDGMRGPCGRLCSTCSDQESCHASKLASAFGVPKTAAGEKLAELVKQVPAAAVKGLSGSEPDLPPEVLTALASRGGPGLGALTMLGIILKPHEHKHFEDAKVDIDSEAKMLVAELLHVVRKYLRARTCFGEPFRERLLRFTHGNFALPTPPPVKHAVLDKVSAAYSDYRRDVLMKLSQAREAVEGDPKLREVLLGESLVNMFSKHASHTKVADISSVAYMLGAHFSEGLLSTTAVAEVANNNPWLLTEGHLA